VYGDSISDWMAWARTHTAASSPVSGGSWLGVSPAAGVPEHGLVGRVVHDVEEVLTPGEEARDLVERNRGELGPELLVDLVADGGRPGGV